MKSDSSRSGLAMLAAAILAGCADLPQRATVGEFVSSDDGCALLIDALERARAQPQVAQFLVDAADHLLAPEPVAFGSGDFVHEGIVGAYEVRRLAEGQDPLLDALRAARSAGSARCALAGHDSYRGAGVTRIRFLHPQVADGHNPVTRLVSETTHLPVHHTYIGIEGRGFASFYGGPTAAGAIAPIEGSWRALHSLSAGS